MAVKHNRNMVVENEELHNGLESILIHATEWNKHVYECIQAKTYHQGQIYAEVRDSFLKSYYEITGIQIDYGDLDKE